MAFINDCYDAGISIPTPGTRLLPGLIKRGPALSVRTIGALNLLLVSAALKSFADESNAPMPPPAIQQEETNSRETLRAILRIEDQLRSNQLATDQNGREAREAAARNAELLSKGMQTIEEAFSGQQRALSDRNVRELQAMQSFNRVMLIVGGTFATVASLAILMVVYFQWRTSKAWAEISTGRLGSQRLGGGSTDTALGPGDSRALDTGPVEDSKSHLLRAMGQLETRVQELEQTTGLPPQAHELARSRADNGDAPAAWASGACDSNRPMANGQASIAALLGQGQARLKANDCEAALKCFDELLALDPNHSEALVKKGAALERLKKLDEAFECYDRAIAADDSMTAAYLHKGGLCSRLERFKEALECYEKALRTHTEWGGSS